jgi:hypothetical protein
MQPIPTVSSATISENPAGGGFASSVKTVLHVFPSSDELEITKGVRGPFSIPIAISLRQRKLGV